MGLTAGLWSGVSGLLVHGEKMNVIGNNLANVNSVAFKAQRMDFEDFMYNNSYSASGLTQIGRGAAIGAVMSDFSQGPYESTTSATDLAISGRGFFQVKTKNQATTYYTRAGNFSFDREGYLTDPHNYVLQGWRIDNTKSPALASGGVVPSTGVSSNVLGSGVPQDVRLDTWTVEPKQTTQVTAQVNLSNNQGADKSRNSNNPFASLFTTWNGTQPPPNNNTPAIPQDAFSYSTTMKVYDEAGATHVLTIYFDQVSPDDYKTSGSGERMWEYAVTMDPSEDQRKFIDANGNVIDMSSTKSAGMLMTGQLIFDSTGNLKSQTAYTFGGSDSPDSNPGGFAADPDNPDMLLPNMDPTNLDNWKPTAVSNSGFPVFVANFTNITDAQTCGSPQGDKYLIEMDFGLKISDYDNPWTNYNSLGSLTQVAANSANPFWNPGIPSAGPENYTLANRVVNKDYRPGPPASGGPQYVYRNPNYTANNPNSPLYLYDNTRAIGTAAMSNINNMLGNANGTPAAPRYRCNLANPTLDQLKDPANWSETTDNGGAWTTPTTSPFSFQMLTSQPNTLINTNAVIDTTAGAANKVTTMLTTLNASLTGGAQYRLAAPVTAANATFAQLNDPASWEYDDGTGAGFLALPAGTGSPFTSDMITGYTLYPNTMRDAIKSAEQSLRIGAPDPINSNSLAMISPPAYAQPNASTSYDGASSTLYQAQDGYGFGNLVDYMVDRDGILSGVYSNGVSLPLYQIVLYDFTCNQGLRREGGNLFSQTRESGEPKSGPPGVSGLGTISSQSLEQSNVDMAREFVLMITTQRGFQSNSKTITTADTMLDTVIQMKR